MQRLYTMVGCLALVGAFLVGCGSDSKKSSSSSTPAPAPASSPPAATSGGVVDVQMKNTAFQPKQLTAKVGQTIKWINDDQFAHNVKAVKGEEFKSMNFNQGGTYSYKLDKAGTISYECTIHPGMTGTITVTK